MMKGFFLSINIYEHALLDEPAFPYFIIIIFPWRSLSLFCVLWYCLRPDFALHVDVQFLFPSSTRFSFTPFSVCASRPNLSRTVAVSASICLSQTCIYLNIRSIMNHSRAISFASYRANSSTLFFYHTSPYSFAAHTQTWWMPQCNCSFNRFVSGVFWSFPPWKCLLPSIASWATKYIK